MMEDLTFLAAGIAAGTFVAAMVYVCLPAKYQAKIKEALALYKKIKTRKNK